MDTSTNRGLKLRLHQSTKLGQCREESFPKMFSNLSDWMRAEGMTGSWSGAQSFEKPKSIDDSISKLSQHLKQFYWAEWRGHPELETVWLTNKFYTTKDFKLIDEAVKKSEYILEIEDNWDDEGSPGYRKTTWKKAINFIYLYAEEIWEKLSINISPPDILPGPEGSIDLHWKEDNCELLMNIPSDDKFITFYGDNKDGSYIKGKINITTEKVNNGLILWLINNYV